MGNIMAYGRKQDKVYVDVQPNGKAKPLDVIAISNKLRLKGMDKRIAEYRAASRAAAMKLDAIMADLEQGMDKAGLLDDMHLEPWFRFGKSCVVRVQGARERGKAQATNTAADNVSELFDE